MSTRTDDEHSTTEAPVLAQDHPVRFFTAKYGRHAAGHVVITLLISVAVATILIYPIPFLFTTDFINGASNLPHHVWTAAQPLPYGSDVEPDVIMRSIWVHGSYMRALDPAVLEAALGIQDELLGSTENFSPVGVKDSSAAGDGVSADLSPVQRDAIHVTNGLTDRSWFFHSPLQYWGCSLDRLQADTDILATVNEKKNQSTSAGVTLRHSIVFSGKRFQERQLMAADALVITLLHLRNSPIGRQWERKALLLSDRLSWDIYPADGHAKTSRLYEFQFLPISIHDSISLTLAYGLTVGYFLISLSKLRAVKSKTGLMVTVITQVAFSVMSSFTICAVLNMDLSRIPRAAYPLTILSMSLENVFRLINAVILTPPADSTSKRIGHAFGETAPIAMASTAQNVVILLALSRWVSAGVSAFCVFAAIAIVFDFFFLSTFFLSVLSVDVRRLELSDALEKASMQHTGRASTYTSERPSWVERALQGKMALSTRIAGTIITVGFVLIAQWHFFDDEPMSHTVSRLWSGRALPDAHASGSASPLKDLHQARSPTSWLRLQDHETAEEVIRIIRPLSHSYVARVYEPLVLVLGNSDRNPPGKEPSLLPAAYDFVNHQMARFVVIVIMVVAAIRLLTSFLLWEEDEQPGASGDINLNDTSSLLSVKSLNGGHALDIALMAQASDGHLVTVGLDRIVRVWNIRAGLSSYVVADGRHEHHQLFPILTVQIDDQCFWLALLSTSRISFWSLPERQWTRSRPIESKNRRLECLWLDSRHNRRLPAALIVWRDGTVTDLLGGDDEVGDDLNISGVPLSCAQVFVHPSESEATPKLATLCSTLTRPSRGSCACTNQDRGNGA